MCIFIVFCEALGAAFLVVAADLKISGFLVMYPETDTVFGGQGGASWIDTRGDL